MTVVQVLVINLLTDGLPAVALARDPGMPGHERLARPRTGALLSARLWTVLAAVGLLVGIAAFAAFSIGRAAGGDTGQTMAFVTVGLAELAFVFSCRSSCSRRGVSPGIHTLPEALPPRCSCSFWRSTCRRRRLRHRAAGSRRTDHCARARFRTRRGNRGCQSADAPTC